MYIDALHIKPTKPFVQRFRRNEKPRYFYRGLWRCHPDLNWGSGCCRPENKRPQTASLSHSCLDECADFVQIFLSHFRHTIITYFVVNIIPFSLRNVNTYYYNIQRGSFNRLPLIFLYRDFFAIERQKPLIQSFVSHIVMLIEFV